MKAFGVAAEIVVASGFDGIEIHAMHEGCLLDQFTVAIWNRRSDKYGGDLKGRLTFPIEVLHAIKDRVGKEFPVQVRFIDNEVGGKGNLPKRIASTIEREGSWKSSFLSEVPTQTVVSTKIKARPSPTTLNP